MNIEVQLAVLTTQAIHKLYSKSVDPGIVQVQPTRKEFKGDYTIVVFPLLKAAGKGPVQAGQEIGEELKRLDADIESFEVVSGFLNLSFTNNFWIRQITAWQTNPRYGFQDPESRPGQVMIEFSSPNTNKPLHLGHIRNNLLGFSLARILEANGQKVIRANLINDRGIHICKSMLAWMKWGQGITPEKAGKKGDHLVGDFYVKFDQEYRKEIAGLTSKGLDEEEAGKQAPLIREAQEMLRKWEAQDAETRALWQQMNQWVYEGFDHTYRRMGIAFDRVYHESETYHLGKQIVLDGLHRHHLKTSPDGAILADLTSAGLDEKVLLRADGTSVYMTQDIGTAHQRFAEFELDKLIYVVGNEQNYHFQVLRLVLELLEFEWAGKIHHLSYGMVELPSGKMKSREGTVVDADQLMDEMEAESKRMSAELGKTDQMSQEEARDTIRIIAQGALNYFILKVDPKKNMLFIPEESIDFNGNTGPFIQYTHARVRSVNRKGREMGFPEGLSSQNPDTLSGKEKSLLRLIYQFPGVVTEAANTLNPSMVANYCYEVAREYNQFYHDFPILKEERTSTRDFRRTLSDMTGRVLKSGLWLLGIEAPEKM